MEWPQELLEIFNEPEFANIHPSVPRSTTDDRLREGFMSISAWYKENGREPLLDAERSERTFAIQLKGIRETDWKRETLRKLDEFNLLDGQS